MNLFGKKSRYLNITLPIGKGLKARIVEKPGLWLEPDDLTRLTQDIRAIALTTF